MDILVDEQRGINNAPLYAENLILQSMKANHKTQEYVSHIVANNEKFDSDEGDEPAQPAHESLNRDYLIHKGENQFRKQAHKQPQERKPNRKWKITSAKQLLKQVRKSVTIQFDLEWSI